ncbi:hypothetical protein BWQ96_06786 [Gracilariopsis chorda]|uniref:Uncharacterized protein n=1 Tax=Gracilariopsis chorda TaxID=448386 RepID=A0A2V3IN49_9FLOR|nr:hypothetical protein BWQ96_06786 [Gracilariopsis chorda]|eukprot:PXF43493.1 hypothetical protein BWQ96_06786 [Gracilariopsis chorda]
MPNATPPTDQSHMHTTITRLQTELARRKRTLEKTLRNETQLEQLLLTSERDIESLRQQLQHQKEHAQNQNHEKDHLFKHAHHQLTQCHQQLGEYQSCLNHPTEQGKDDCKRFQPILEHKDRIHQHSTTHLQNSLNQRDHQMQQLVQDVTNLSKQSHQLHQRCQQQKEHHRQLEQQRDSFKHQAQRLQAQLTDLHHHSHRLRSQLSQMPDPDTHRQVQSQLEHLRKQFNNVQTQLHDSRQQANVFKHQCAVHENTIVDTNSQLHTVKQQLSEARQRLQSQSSQFDAALDQARIANEQLQANLQQVEKLLQERPTEEQYHKLQSTVAEKEHIITLKHSLLQAADHQASQTQQRTAARVSELHSHLQDARTASEELKTNVQQLQHQLEQRPTEEQYRTLQSNLAEKERIISQNDANLQDANQKASQAQQRAHARVSELELHLQDARTATDQLKTSVQQLENQLEQRPTEEQYQTLQSSVVQKERIISEKDALLQAAKESLSEDQQRAAARVSELDSQFRDARTAHSELAANLQQLQQQLQERPTEEQYQALQSAVAEKEQIIAKKQSLLHDANQQLSEAQQRLTSQASEFQVEISNARDANKDLEATLQGVQDELAKRPTEESYQEIQSNLKEHEELISQKDSLLQSTSQQLSETVERADALKSEFESRLNDARATNDELRTNLEETESKLKARPTTQELQELKNNLEDNASALTKLQEERDSLQNDLDQLKETCEKQRVEIEEKTNLLVDAKNQLVECGEHINASEARLKEEISRFNAMFEEKDGVIADMESKLSECKQEATTSTHSLEQERQRLEKSLEETRKKASEELGKVCESHQVLAAEHADLQKQFHELSLEREMLKKQLAISDSTISSKQSVLESLKTEEQGLSQKLNKLVRDNSSLQKMLQKSDSLVAEAKEASEKVVHVQALEYTKEKSALQAQLALSKSQEDISIECLRRIVKRLNHILTLAHDRENIGAVEINEETSTNQLQAAANAAVVAIEEDLQVGIHLHSEVQVLEAREEALRKRIESLEDENTTLITTVHEAQAEAIKKNSHIEALTNKHNEMGKIAATYKQIAEESEKRLQDQEDAAEVTISAVSEELGRVEREYKRLQAAKTDADHQLQDLSRRLAAKANVEAQLDEIQKAHAERTKDVSVQIKRLEEEKKILEAKLTSTSSSVSSTEIALEEMRQSLLTITNERDQLEMERKKLDSERHSLEERNKEMVAECDKIKSEVERLSAALKEKASIEVLYSSANENHKQELSAMDNKLRELVETKSNLQQQLVVSSNDLKLAREALETCEEKLRSADQRCSDLTTERGRATADILQLKDAVRLASEQKASLQESIPKLEHELESLRASNASYIAADASLRENVVSRQKELDESFSKQSDLSKKIASLEEDIQNSAILFEEQKDSLIVKLDQEKKSELAKLQNDFKARFREASERAEQTINNLSSEVTSLEAKLRDSSIELESRGDDLRGQLEAKESELAEMRRKLQAATEAHQVSQSKREELEAELEENRCVLKENQVRVEELIATQREKEEEIRRFTEKYERAATAIHVLESRVSDSETTNAQVEADLRKNLLDLSEKLQSTKTERAELERCLQDKEELSTKRLTEIERLTSTVIPRLKEEADTQQQETERLAGILDAKNQEWKTLNSTLSHENMAISCELDDAKRKLRLSEEAILRKESVIEDLKKDISEKDKELEALEGTQPRKDEMLRKASEHAARLQREVDLHREWKEEETRRSTEVAERLHREIDIHQQRIASFERELGNKEAEYANVEAQFQKSNEKCINLEKEMEKLSLSMSDLKEKSEEVTELQRVYGKLTRKVKNLQRKAHRAELSLRHERKKHAAVTKKYELESKRQVSPSTKGLSPAMKRARAQSLRPPLSPRDANARPPLMPKLQNARRSLDFG